MTSDASGYYEKVLPNALQYIVSVNPGPIVDVWKYSFPSGTPSQRKMVVRNGPETQLDFTMGDPAARSGCSRTTNWATRWIRGITSIRR